MTSPFRSTHRVAARRRQRPLVERSTFVVASMAGAHVAFPVEQVVRVERLPAGTDARVLVVQAADAQGTPLTLAVDRVHEVLAIETALVQPVGERCTLSFAHAVRGCFRHMESTVWVVDATRLGTPL